MGTNWLRLHRSLHSILLKFQIQPRACSAIFGTPIEMNVESCASADTSPFSAAGSFSSSGLEVRRGEYPFKEILSEQAANGQMWHCFWKKNQICFLILDKHANFLDCFQVKKKNLKSTGFVHLYSLCNHRMPLLQIIKCGTPRLPWHREFQLKPDVIRREMRKFYWPLK